MAEASLLLRSPRRRRRGSRCGRFLLPALLGLALPLHLAAPGAASPLRLDLVPVQVRQGGLAVLRIAGPGPIRPLRVSVGDREIPVPPGNSPSLLTLLVGIDLEQPPGRLPIRVDAQDARGRPLTAERALRVLDAHFPVQHLTVPRPFVDLDAATLERVTREKAVLDRLWETVTPDRLWRGPFRPPLDGAGPGSGFGERRIINGEPRSPHTGADFPAPAGTEVVAANAGTVALVADQFFSGTSVILDHGLGLYTMYFHLQESLVRAGQGVERGEIIARVGSSGRATGPHLHWGARLVGARIDPRALLQRLPME